MIINTYESIEDKESLFMSMIGSLCLEGICFYSGFFLPLWLAGQGKMVNSGEIINLILRDEKLHTVGAVSYTHLQWQSNRLLTDRLWVRVPLREPYGSLV